MPEGGTKMYHSITFYDTDGLSRNTWDDWHLAPSSRPFLAPPVMKTQIVEIPGADGVLDLSTSLTNGRPIFQNREGSWEFIVINGYGTWSDRYSEIMNYIHGKIVKVKLETDPEWYYEGRLTIENWASPSDGTWSTITIKYSVKPYKYKFSNPSIKSL